jgi:hypothetical protein
MMRRLPNSTVSCRSKSRLEASVIPKR